MAPPTGRDAVEGAAQPSVGLRPRVLRAAPSARWPCCGSASDRGWDIRPPGRSPAGRPGPCRPPLASTGAARPRRSACRASRSAIRSSRRCRAYSSSRNGTTVLIPSLPPSSWTTTRMRPSRSGRAAIAVRVRKPGSIGASVSRDERCKRSRRVIIEGSSSGETVSGGDQVNWASGRASRSATARLNTLVRRAAHRAGLLRQEVGGQPHRAAGPRAARSRTRGDLPGGRAAQPGPAGRAHRHVDPAFKRPSTRAAAKLARATTDRPDSQLRPPGQPPTFGGKNSSWPSRPVHSASSSVLGGGANRSRPRTVPMTNSTGSETWACRFLAEKNRSERRIVSTARPMCSPSAAAARPVPRSPRHRRRPRRGTPGTAARPAAATWPADRAGGPQVVRRRAGRSGPASVLSPSS